MPAPAMDGGGPPAWWRSSLRVRVITTTVAVALVLALILFNLLFAQVAQGLVAQAVETATVDAAQQTRRAQEQFDAIDRTDDSSLNTAAFETVNLVAPADQQTRRAVLARSVTNDRDAVISTNASSDIGLEAIPMALRAALDSDAGNQQVLVTEVSLDDAVGPIASVLVGSRVDIPRAGAHDLFLVYPMQREQDTLDLVRRWFLIGGLAFLVLVGGVSWLASRMVTVPVGRAAQVSQELARGRLDERLPLRGSEDELDQLATSFNTMADSLEHQIRQLETLSHLQQRFVSDVSHELRTPLTTIRMAGEVLHASRGDFTVPVARSAELLYEELNRFEELLTELLEISRYDSGAAELAVERVDLVDLVRGVVEASGTLARHSGSTLSVTSNHDVIAVDMDQRRVSRILRNLVGNAIEHGEGKPVDIAVELDGSLVRVTVRDHGMGMTDEQAAHVFERFWRADSARTRTTGGTGLGLAISVEDAHLHGGWLQAAGRPGQGAVFRLTLPQASGTIVPEPAPLVLEKAPVAPGGGSPPAPAAVPLTYDEAGDGSGATAVAAGRRAAAPAREERG